MHMMVLGDYIISKSMINTVVLVGIYTDIKLYNKELLQFAYIEYTIRRSPLEVHLKAKAYACPLFMLDDPLRRWRKGRVRTKLSNHASWNM